jgi:NADH-quinone oxidoreductase subunit N
MYFDEPGEALEARMEMPLAVILSAATAFTFLYIAYPSPLIVAAEAAAASLFP